MYDYGYVVGKFAPLTRGHIMLINQAATKAKKVIVVLSHDQRWVDAQKPRDREVLSLKNRLRWLQQTFAQDKHIEIAVIDESEIPQYPNGWEAYAGMLGKLINGHLAEDKSLMYLGTRKVEMGFQRTAKTAAIFSSEVDYDENYKKYLPYVSHEVVDAHRTTMPISATKVREDLYANWEYLPSIVRRDYTRKVVILGTESTGKTTLVRALAKYFNTSWVEEYGRVYVETELAGSEATLRSTDYPLIAYRHKHLEEKAMRSANRICLVDTNALITEFYHRLYEGCSNPVVSAIARSENYDLVIILRDNVPWVNDGMRSNPDRTKTWDLFQDMLVEYPNQTPEYTYTIESDNFNKRYLEAVSIIDDYMSNYNI